jgi:hypothetical protein
MNKASLIKQSKKTVATILAAMAVLTMCAFSTSEKTTTDPPKDKKPVVSFAHLNPQPDSTTVSILDADVAAIVFGAKKATLSHLNPMEPPADGEATIGGVKVIKTLGTLNKTDLIMIQFLMADSAFYNNGSVTVTSPYAPNYAISFAKGKQKIDLVFSLVSFEMGIVVDGKLTKVVHYNNARQVTRFFRLVSQNEFFDKTIEAQK